jgi:hypothetical protein
MRWVVQFSRLTRYWIVSRRGTKQQLNDRSDEDKKGVDDPAEHVERRFEISFAQHEFCPKVFPLQPALDARIKNVRQHYESVDGWTELWLAQ